MDNVYLEVANYQGYKICHKTRKHTITDDTDCYVIQYPDGLFSALLFGSEKMALEFITKHLSKWDGLVGNVA